MDGRKSRRLKRPCATWPGRFHAIFLLGVQRSGNCDSRSEKASNLKKGNGKMNDAIVIAVFGVWCAIAIMISWEA